MIREPWLWLPASLAHKLAPAVLKSLTLFSSRTPPEWQPFEWRGLRFPNRLGIAGGVDKNGSDITSWWALGAGFVEVGTVTPRPQPGNTPPVVARDLARRALWNRMGFPSRGADVVQRRLQALASPRPTPLFANIGKNAATPLEAAADDYIDLLRRLRGLVDGFVVNISSPNTKGLRDLLQPERLTDFLRPLVAERREPLLLKISPDLDDEDLARVLTISHDLGIDGWILTNTSQGLREGLSFPKEGGVSGSPLAARSTDVLRRSLALLGARRAGKLIVSVGGVMSPADVRERLALGADLVQVYSALIFEGPYFFRKVARWQRVNPPA